MNKNKTIDPFYFSALTTAAAAGDSKAQQYLAWLYYNGQGVKRNYEKAAEVVTFQKISARIVKMIKCSANSFCLLIISTLFFGVWGSSMEARESIKDTCENILPREIKKVLSDQFPNWILQKPDRLNSYAFDLWNSEQPKACPGIASGRFENDKESFAVLLVSKSENESGYKLFVFSNINEQSPYQQKELESRHEGSRNLFVRSVPIKSFFDYDSQKAFRAFSKEGILIIDNAEDESETDIYYFANGEYKHSPVDY